MRVGELARKAKITTDTVRYYEKIGLLSPPRRTDSNYRDYSPGTVKDLMFIKKAQASGLQLEQIREVLEIISGGTAPCDHVRETVTARLGDVEARLKELRTLRGALRGTLARLDSARPATTEGSRCSALEGVG